MKLNRFAQLGAVAAVAALALAGCASNEAPPAGGGDPSEGASNLTGTLNATGASSQDAAEQAWIADFQTTNNGVTINYQATGSGVGRDNFLEGASDFIGSDRAYNEEEITAGGWAGNGKCVTDGLVEIPVYISPVAVIFNLEGVDELNLTPDVIGRIFNLQITTWNDPAIQELNADAELPATQISPVHRSDPSGTSETFTSYLEDVAPEAWPYEASDEWPVPGGEAASGTAGVVSAVTGGEGTIGYADASQANDLGTVAVAVGEEFVAYSSEAAATLVAASPLEEGRGDGDLVFDINPAEAPAGSYPIALVSYLIACEEYEDSATAELVRAYFEYVVTPEGQDVAAEEAGSAPITEDLREQIMGAIELIA